VPHGFQAARAANGNGNGGSPSPAPPTAAQLAEKLATRTRRDP